MTWRDIPGWFDFEALYSRVAHQARPGCVLVEVGCWLGRSIAYLATELRYAAIHPRMIVAVDTWSGSPAEPDMLDAVEKRGGPQAVYDEFCENMLACGLINVRPLQMASVEAAKFFPPCTVDFCFIDASHDYESVKADLDAWLPAMKPGGLLAGHDLNMPDVERAVRERFGNDFETEGICWLKRIDERSDRQ